MAIEDFEPEPEPPAPPLDSRHPYVDMTTPPDAQPGTASSDTTGVQITVDNTGDLTELRLTATALEAGTEALTAEILQLYQTALRTAKLRARQLVEATDGQPLPCRRRGV